MMAAPFPLLVLCWAFRLSCSANPPEWFNNISTSLFRLPGDIMLGGLFPINHLSSNLSQRRKPDNIKCERLNEAGLGHALVMKYAVDEINANQRMLPGIKLGYEIYDTCQQSAVVVKPTMSFLTAKSNNVLSVECNYTNHETSISAVIGPSTSEMVSVIGKLLGFFLMPQVSYAATSDIFSDKVLYPSFFRTVPSDKGQVSAMAHLMKEFNWNWVAVVGSEEEYGQRGVQEFSKAAENMSVCVAYQGLIPVYSDPESAIDNIINNILATKVRVVVVFSLAQASEDFFKQVIRRNVTAVWIASTSWAISNLVTSLPNIQSIGTVIGFIDKIKTVDLLTAYTQELLTKLSEEREMTPPTATKSKGNPDNPCPQCCNLSPANISLVTDTAVSRTAFSVYAAIYSVAQALHNLLGCNSTACMQGTKIYPWKLFEALRNTSVDVNDTHLKFDSSGNPNIGYDVIEWVQKASGFDFIDVGSFYEKLSINKSLFKWHTANSKVPQSTCSAECKKGQIRRVKGFHSCCFDCIDCAEGTYQDSTNKISELWRCWEMDFIASGQSQAICFSLPPVFCAKLSQPAAVSPDLMHRHESEDNQCTKCPDREWSPVRSTNCTKPTFFFLSYDTSEALEMIMAGVLVLICQVLVGVVFLKHQGTLLVTASGGALSFVALLSLMGACLSLLLFLGEPGDIACRLQLPLTSIFQTVTLSIITTISLQILYVTEFPKTATSHLHILRGPVSWLFVLVCCAVQAGLCGWFVQEKPLLSEYEAAMNIYFLEAFLSCPVSLTGFAVTQGFNGAMALISFMCTFMAAKPLHQYNLARDITFSSLIYCVIWVTFIPIYMDLNNKNRSIVHVCFNLISNFGLLAAYYFPKCYLLLRKPELNTAEHFCTFLEGIPVTQEEPQPQKESGN